jgi:hypothetical protein
MLGKSDWLSTAMAKGFHRSFVGVLISAFGILALTNCFSALAKEWSFKVKNSAGIKIVKFETKEKGGSWGDFDLSGGISPGRTMELVWDSSTNNQECVQSIRAKFSDGSYSSPAKFDFCDTPLTIEIF